MPQLNSLIYCIIWTLSYKNKIHEIMSSILYALSKFMQSFTLHLHISSFAYPIKDWTCLFSEIINIAIALIDVLIWQSCVKLRFHLQWNNPSPSFAKCCKNIRAEATFCLYVSVNIFGTHLAHRFFFVMKFLYYTVIDNSESVNCCF